MLPYILPRQVLYLRAISLSNRVCEYVPMVYERWTTSGCMSLAITHFALGAVATSLLLGFLAPEIPYQRTWAVVGGLWALVPDIHYISPVYQEFLFGIKASPLGNVFWFHGLLDQHSMGRGSREEAFVMVIALLLGTFLIEYINRVNPDE